MDGEHSESSSDLMPEPVPYEHGNHCIFYALQDANTHFNRRGLTVEDRDRWKKKTQRLSELYKVISGREKELGAALKLSLTFMLPRLERLGIEPTSFMCKEETKSIIDQIRAVKKSGASFIVGEKPVISFPVLLFIDGADGTHTWFCSDIVSWLSERKKHINKKTDHIVLALPLKRKVEAPKT